MTEAKRAKLSSVLYGRKSATGLTFAQLAEKVEVCETTLLHWFKNPGHFRLAVLLRMFELLDIPAEERRKFFEPEKEEEK